MILQNFVFQIFSLQFFFLSPKVFLKKFSISPIFSLKYFPRPTNFLLKSFYIFFFQKTTKELPKKREEENSQIDRREPSPTVNRKLASPTILYSLRSISNYSIKSVFLGKKICFSEQRGVPLRAQGRQDQRSATVRAKENTRPSG